MTSYPPLLARAETLQSYNQYAGNPDYITADLDRYRKTNLQAVQDTAVKYLTKASRVEVITMPAAAPDTTPAPAPVAVEPVKEAAPPEADRRWRPRG